MRLPRSLHWLQGAEEGRAWLDALPERIAEATERWSLELGEPYEDGFVSLVLPARRDGELLVLKLQFPGRESEHEATALRAWGGDGAVHLLDHATELHALLLERCVPGTHLAAATDVDPLPVLSDLVRRLAIPAGPPFTSLEEEAGWWVSYLPDRWEGAARPFERRLLDAAVELLESLRTSQGDQVLLHQDLHGDNVLQAERERWLAIDPKPLSGELAFAAAPIIRSFELGHSRDAVLHRLDFLSDRLGVDRERARGWCIGQTVAWSVGDGAHERHLDTARWLLDA